MKLSPLTVVVVVGLSISSVTLWAQQSQPTKVESTASVKTKKVATDIRAFGIRNYLDKGIRDRKGDLPAPITAVPTHVFGTRKLSGTPASFRHVGWTYVVEPGTPIKSIASGVVIFSDRIPGYGLIVIVDHGASDHSLYAHLRATKVKAGDRTKTGRVIGTSGESGSDEGAKFYFELRIDGIAVDPTGWFMESKP